MERKYIYIYSGLIDQGVSSQILGMDYDIMFNNRGSIVYSNIGTGLCVLTIAVTHLTVCVIDATCLEVVEANIKTIVATQAGMFPLVRTQSEVQPALIASKVSRLERQR